MDQISFDQAASLLREAAETLDHHGSFRMRVLMQMLLLELEKERARNRHAERTGPQDPEA